MSDYMNPRAAHTTRRDDDRRNLFAGVALLTLFLVIIGFAVFSPPTEEPAQAHAMTSVTNTASVKSGTTVVRLGLDGGGQWLLSAQSTKWAVTSIIVDPGQCVSINGGAQRCSSGASLYIPLGLGQYYVRRTR